MGSSTDFSIDQVDSIGEVNNLSDEHFRDVMEELTNHQIPEREKCPLVRRLNASISGYFKSTGDVGYSKVALTNTTNIDPSGGCSSLAGDLSAGAYGNNVNRDNHGVDSDNSIELIEYRRAFEVRNYRSPKNCSDVSDVNNRSKSSEKSKLVVNCSTTKNSTITSSTASSSSSSSSNNCKIFDSSSPTSSSPLNIAQSNGSSVDSFVIFDSLKRLPIEPSTEPSAEDASLNVSNITTITESVTSNVNVTNNISDNSKDDNKDTDNKEINTNGGGDNNNADNNTKGNRNAKTEKKKKPKKGETVYTAGDIDGHIGDHSMSIEELVCYVTGNKRDQNNGNSSNSCVGPSATLANPIITSCTNTNTNTNTSGSGSGSGSGSVCSSSNICDTKPSVVSKKSKDGNGNGNGNGSSGGKVKKKEKLSSPTSSSSPSLVANNSTTTSSNNNNNIQGRNKKGSSNTISFSSETTISSSNINLSNSNSNSNNNDKYYDGNNRSNCASTNGNFSDYDVKNFGHFVEKPNCSVYSGLGESGPKSASATTLDSKCFPSHVSQSEIDSIMNVSSTSPILSKSHSIESSLSSSSMQIVTKTPITGSSNSKGKSQIKAFDDPASNKESNTCSNASINSEGLTNKTINTSTTSTIVTANDALGNSFTDLRFTASDSEMADQETSFQTVKSKNFKRRKGVSRKKGDLRMPSPSPRSSNNIFTNSSSSSATPSVTSSTGNSVNTSITARGYESEREYCADEYRRRKDYLNHRKLASSMPHSEQNSADNSDMESSCSYPVSGRMPILPTPPGPPPTSSLSSSSPSSNNNNNSNSSVSTSKVSYADIAKMGSIIGVTPSTGLSKGPSPTNLILNNKNNNNSVKDANNNISTENSPKNSIDSVISVSLKTNSLSTPCSPCPSSSPNCVSPLSNQTSFEVSKTTKNNFNNNNNNNKMDALSEDATLPKVNSPTIKSENNLHQCPSKDGKAIGNNLNNSSNSTNLAAVIIRPKYFDTPKETKNENEKVICDENVIKSNSIKPKKDKKLEKTITASSSATQLASSSLSSPSPSPSTQTQSKTSSISSNSTNTSTTHAKCSKFSTATTNSKTLEALLSPPAEKTPTFDIKKENITNIKKLADSRVASIESVNRSSRASTMLKKSNSIPVASVKINSYRSTSIQSNNSTPSSLPPVIMNDGLDASDEIESSFTFGFFDDVTSIPTTNLSSAQKQIVNTSSISNSTKEETISLSPSPSVFSAKVITNKATNTTITPTPPAVSKKSTNSSVNNKNTNSDMVLNVNSNSNNINSSSRVKSSKNNTSSTITPTTTTSTVSTAPIINSIETTDESKSMMVTSDVLRNNKDSDKDIKSTFCNNTSLDKFDPVKLAEPPATMDADINTFNYSQIINFIKTAWESSMCQYHRSSDRNSSQNSSSPSSSSPSPPSSSSKGANLFRESTSYYKELVYP